ncbi:MAG: PAS domain S-box protein [Actinomycetes bacterium]
MNSPRPVSHLRAGLGLAGARSNSSSEEIFRALAAHTPVGIFVSNPAGSCEYVNRRWCDLSGLTPEQALGEGWRSALHPEDAERIAAAWAAAASEGRDSIAEYRFLRPDGSVIWIEGYATAIRDSAEAVTGWIGTCIDVTPRRNAEEAVLASDERFRAAFDNAPIGMGFVAPDGRWLQVNGALCRLLGYTEDEILTLTLTDLTVPGDAEIQIEELGDARSETRTLSADGQTVWVAASTTLVRDGGGDPLYYIVQIEDIGDRKQTEHELRRLADHDPLTGILNRRGFTEGLRRELRRMERHGEYGALLLLDLDNFKLVNDTAGHPEGDRVLRATADVLRRRLRATDVIGRLGGDEFAALIMNVTPRQAREISTEIEGSIRDLRISGGAVDLEITASIGVIAVDHLAGEREDDLLAAVDRAMYRAKSLNRDR